MSPLPSRRWLAALLAAALVPAGGRATTDETCPALLARRPLAAPSGTTAVSPAAPSQPQPSKPEPSPDAGDYRQQLRPTPLGWVHRRHWCVWIEPGTEQMAAAPWEQRWRRAVEAALRSWQAEVGITVVADPDRAQIQLHRRRPPLRAISSGDTGRPSWRASHGRAELALQEVQRQSLAGGGKHGAVQGGRQGWRREPLVDVMISPGQHERAIQATALHELGHALGLWGHSDRPGDALSAVPGANPVLELSARDRATVQWLLRQPSAVDP